MMDHIKVDAGKGHTMLHGHMEGDVYTKYSWKPFSELFSNGSRYLMIRAWEEIKDIARVIELHDRVGKRGYRISTVDAARHGEEHTFTNQPPPLLRVPTDKWEMFTCD